MLNCSQGHDHDVAISVTNGTRKLIGQLNPEEFSDANGIVSVTYSGVTSVTVGAFSLREKGR